MKHSTKLCRDSRHSILDSGWQVSIIQHPGSFLFLLLLFFSNLVQAQYKPTPENLKNREWFQDAKFGLFIHWGVYSVLGDGEWIVEDLGSTNGTFVGDKRVTTPVKLGVGVPLRVGQTVLQLKS